MIVVWVIAVGVGWELWRSLVEPILRLSRMYGWRKGWRFYRFLDRDVGKEADWNPSVVGTAELRKRIPKRK